MTCHHKVETEGVEKKCQQLSLIEIAWIHKPKFIKIQKLLRSYSLLRFICLLKDVGSVSDNKSQ